MKPIIDHVSDTSLWVAVYRAQESKREDRLFSDPLAERLAGEQGEFIARTIKGSRFSAWSVVMRTQLIDRYILKLVSEGVDTVLNLGAGLDTRPYRLELPSAQIRWIEVDYPKIIQHKEKILLSETPRCKLERVSLDLSDIGQRRALFNRVSGESKRVLVITEGVLPYLTNDEVASLARDLRQQANFRYWIAEYFSPSVIKYLQSDRRKKQMGNAPFRFAPGEWLEFFSGQGWKVYERAFLAQESMRLGRAVPMPWWVYPLRIFASKSRKEEGERLSGYFIYEPSD